MSSLASQAGVELLVRSGLPDTHARASQAGVEALVRSGLANTRSRVSQAGVEALVRSGLPDTQARVSQAGLELLGYITSEGPPPGAGAGAFASQSGLEILRRNPAHSQRMSQVALEVARTTSINDPPGRRISQLSLEVMRSVEDAIPKPRVSQIAVEVMRSTHDVVAVSRRRPTLFVME